MRNAKNIREILSLVPVKMVDMSRIMNLFVCLTLLVLLAPTQVSAETTYYHVDLQGTPIATTDESGVLKWEQSSAAFGYNQGASVLQTSDPDAHLAFGLGGHVEETIAGRSLVYMQARFYDPEFGRFLSMDPVGFMESNPQSFNRYAYGNNNPNRYVDPDGREPTSDLNGDEDGDGIPDSVDKDSPENIVISPNAGYELRPNGIHEVGIPMPRLVAKGVIIVTPAGVAVSAKTLAKQGSSHLAGNFRGLAGSSVDDIISRVPRDWKMVPQDRGAGIKFLDSQGFERIRLHGPSSRAPAGSNSASGWTMRVMDRTGKYFDDAGNVVPYRSNAGHIPISGNPN